MVVVFDDVVVRVEREEERRVCAVFVVVVVVEDAGDMASCVGVSFILCWSGIIMLMSLDPAESRCRCCGCR